MSKPLDKHIIFGVHITERLKRASLVQDCLTKYGCNIKTRIGLHEVSHEFCSSNGLLILEMFGDEGKVNECQKQLNGIEGVEIQRIEFDHA